MLPAIVADAKLPAYPGRQRVEDLVDAIQLPKPNETDQTRTLERLWW